MPATEDAVCSLHRKMGVRGENSLFTLLFRNGSHLGKHWGIQADDPPLLRQASVAIRVLNAINATHLDTTKNHHARVLFNVVNDAHVYSMSYNQRMDLILSRPKSPSARTLERTRSDVSNHLCDGLRTALPPIADRRLDEQVLLETHLAELASTAREADPLVERIRQAHRSPFVVAAESVPAFDVFVLTTDFSKPVVLRTADKGDWLPVFTSHHAMTTYRAAIDAPGTGYRCLNGGEAIQAVAKWGQVGIVVNPAPERGADPTATLRLSPDDVYALSLRDPN